MRKLKKIVAILAAAALSVTLFAGCSNGGSNGGDTQAVKMINIPLTDEQYAFGVDKDQPELLEQVNQFIADIKSDGTLEEILNKYFEGGTPEAVVSAELDTSKDQLVVATNAAFEPFEYTLSTGNEYYGVDMELAKLLADRLDKELVIQNMNFDAVCLSVGQHQCDIAMAGLTVSPTREEYVQFSDSYYNASQVVVARGDDTTFDSCTTAEEVEEVLKGLGSDVTIGCQTGTTGQFYVDGDEGLGFEGLTAQSRGYQNASLAMQDLINGNINYVIVDIAPAEKITEAINAVA
mgnify:FL=1